VRPESIIVVLLGLNSGVALAQEAPAPLYERPSEIGYPSPEAAESALKAKAGVSIREKDNWLVVVDPSDGEAVWTFALRSNPAYPTAIKRKVVERNLEMRVMCWASKDACDKTVRAFRAHDERLLKQ
jgi:hypothetical protein